MDKQRINRKKGKEIYLKTLETQAWFWSGYCCRSGESFWDKMLGAYRKNKETEKQAYEKLNRAREELRCKKPT